MGIHLPYRVPDRVKTTIDRLDTGTMFDVMTTLDIPCEDAPSSDHYDWARQRLFDWLYDENWEPPTDEDVEAQQRFEAEQAVLEAERRLNEARAWRESLGREP